MWQAINGLAYLMRNGATTSGEVDQVTRLSFDSNMCSCDHSVGCAGFWGGWFWGWYVTRFAPLNTLKVISRCKLTSDARVVLHCVARSPRESLDGSPVLTWLS